MIVSFDLDSTLCETSHRAGMIDRVNGTDWDAYSMACAGDGRGPAYWLARTFVEAGAKIVICSARSECARELTDQWLDEQEIPALVVVLYDETVHGDGYKTDVVGHDEWKAEQLERLNDQCIEQFGEGISLHVDDWPHVRDAVEERTGIPVLIVATKYSEATI